MSTSSRLLSEMISLWINLLFIASHLSPGSAIMGIGPVITCYVSGWASYRTGAGKFDPNNVDPSLCSHLVYAFAGLDSSNYTIKSLDPWNDLEDGGGKGGFRKLTQLRRKNVNLRVSIAIGGWNEGSINYSAMASDLLHRKTFIKSVVQMLRQYDFDGLDLDWEYPTKRDGHPTDKENFVALVKELREAFDEQQGIGHRWLLTSAIGAAPDVIQSAYDLPALSQYLDYLHIMTYDYHGPWDLRAGVNAPLQGTSAEDILSLEGTLDVILKAGANPAKIVLGLPFYGRTYSTSNDLESPKLGCSTVKEGLPGPYTKEAGFMGFNEVCEEVQANSSKWKIIWDERSSTPYAVRGNQLISYDDPRSINAKVHFGMKKGIAGVMIWSLDTDDFSGICSMTTGLKNFPLLRTIKKAIRESMKVRENEIYTNSKHMNGGGSFRALTHPLFISSVYFFISYLTKSTGTIVELKLE